MDSIKKQLSFFGSALNIRNKRNDIIASNIANAATPNYKARDINFLDEFKKVTKTGDINITHSNHIPTKNRKKMPFCLIIQGSKVFRLHFSCPCSIEK